MTSDWNYLRSMALATSIKTFDASFFFLMNKTSEIKYWNWTFQISTEALWFHLRFWIQFLWINSWLHSLASTTCTLVHCDSQTLPGDMENNLLRPALMLVEQIWWWRRVEWRVLTHVVNLKKQFHYRSLSDTFLTLLLCSTRHFTNVNPIQKRSAVTHLQDGIKSEKSFAPAWTKERWKWLMARASHSN